MRGVTGSKLPFLVLRADDFTWRTADAAPLNPRNTDSRSRGGLMAWSRLVTSDC